MCHVQETSLSQLGGPHMCKTYLLVRDKSHMPGRWEIFLVCVYLILIRGITYCKSPIMQYTVQCTLAWPSTGPCDANAVKH